MRVYLLKEIAAAMREKPELFGMAYWVGGRTPYFASATASDLLPVAVAEETRCNTVCCIAGEIVARALRETRDLGIHALVKRDGIACKQEGNRFYLYGPNHDLPLSDVHVTPSWETAAAYILGCPETQLTYLFHSGGWSVFWSDVEDHVFRDPINGELRIDGEVMAKAIEAFLKFWRVRNVGGDFQEERPTAK